MFKKMLNIINTLSSIFALLFQLKLGSQLWFFLISSIPLIVLFWVTYCRFCFMWQGHTFSMIYSQDDRFHDNSRTTKKNLSSYIHDKPWYVFRLSRHRVAENTSKYSKREKYSHRHSYFFSRLNGQNVTEGVHYRQDHDWQHNTDKGKHWSSSSHIVI